MTNFTFSFDSRESYLAYRADWRANYAVVSEEIRALKRQMSARKGEDVSSDQSALFYLRRRANKLMIELGEAKDFKNAQLAELAQA